MMDVNVLVVGVGGQGVILASDTVAEIVMNNGYDVKKSDTLGMAQRGGSVVSHVRWGEHVFSPLTRKGDIDFLLGFEQLEAARWASYLKSGGVAIIADVTVIPVSIIGTTTHYPDWGEIEEILAQYNTETYLIPATRIGLEVGNPRALNMVMLGALSAFLDIEEEAWREGISSKLSSRFLKSSLEAFSKGAAEIRSKKVKVVKNDS